MNTRGLLLAAMLLAAFTTAARSQGNEWKKMDGPWGAKVTALAVDRPRSTLVAGTSDGMIFYSTDNGATWSERTHNYPINYPIEAIAANDGKLAIVGYQDCYHSTDGGVTWSNGGRDVITPSDIQNAGVYLSLRYLDDGTLLLTASTGIYLSSNDGVNWSAATMENGERPVVYEVVDVGGALLYDSPAGIGRSTDNGASWSRYNGDLPSGTMVWSMARIADSLFITTSNGLFVSVDEGKHWGGMTVPGFGPRDVYHLAAVGSRLVMTTSAGVSATDDRGATWRQVRPYSAQHLFADGEELFALYTGTMMHASPDLARWDTVRQGMHAALNSLSTSDGMLYATTTTSIQSIAGPSASWRTLNLPPAPSNRAVGIERIVASPRGLYALGRSLFSESTDGGANWTDLLPTLSPDESGSVLGIDATDRWTVAGVAQFGQNPITGEASVSAAIYKESEDGSSWSKTSLERENMLFRQFASEGDTLYVVGITTNFEAGDDKLFRSTDRGESWSELGADAVTEMNGIYAIDGTLFLCSTGGLYRLEDGEWVRSGLRKIDVRSLLRDGGTIYAGTLDGIYASEDGGQTWKEGGLVDTRVDYLAAAGGTIYAGSASGEVYALSRPAGVDPVKSAPASRMELTLLFQGTR